MKKEEKALHKINHLLSDSGVEVNGPNPWDIRIEPQFLVPLYYRVIRYGPLGLGEAYMDGWFNCEELDEFFTKILNADLDKKINPWRMALSYLGAILFNPQTRSGSTKVARDHYDLSPELYESFLDPYNQYTCGYFENTDALDVAQEQKLHLICQKLKLTPEDHVLDIGCGWGGFAKFASKNYGCRVTGVTISSEQAEYARNFTSGLPVTIIQMDYRDLGKEKFSKIVVCGMIEHVGYKNHREFMKIVHKSLADGGLFLLHTIGELKSVTHSDPWLGKYIFPNSMAPSIKQIAKASEGLFTIHDLHNFGPRHYDKTLMAWYRNFKRNWDKVKSDYYDERFYRMWEYYLLSSAASFRSRKSQLYQFVLSKNFTEEYFPVR